MIILFFFLKNINYIKFLLCYNCRISQITKKSILKALFYYHEKFFIAAIFLIIFSLTFYILYDKKKDNVFKLNTCLPLKCDLNSQDCTFLFKGK
ncbi:hypothetical protein E7N89_01315 [Campylobacter coli]|nr:hypothetical protein [Campylobacter coli]